MKMFETVSSGRVLRVFVALCFTAFALLAGACAGPPTSPDGKDSGGTGSSTQVNYTTVGASDAIGVGASVSCLPFIDCPTGTGYVQILHRQLATRGKQVSLLHLGIPGAVLSPRIQTISRSYEPSVNFNLMESELPLVSRDSTVVTIFAGGNDTNVVGRSVSGQANGNPRAYGTIRCGSSRPRWPPWSTAFDRARPRRAS